MFEATRNYPAFYVDKEHGLADEVRDGLRWLRDWPDTDEGLFVTPVKDQLGYSSVTTVTGKPLVAGRQVPLGARVFRPVTWRTYPPSNPWWVGGPVLALWPNREFLGRLHDDNRVRALCVVVGDMDDVRPWLSATRARDIRSGASADLVPELDPVVERAMLDLTGMLNHNNMLVTAYEKSAAVNVLRILKRARLPYDADALYAWALAHGWPSEEAGRFKEFADGVIRGKGYRTGPSMWRDDILKMWRKAAAAGKRS